MRDNIPHFAIIGINHKTADVAIREKIVMNKDEERNLAAGLFEKWKISGCLLLSTCNRTEIYIFKENIKFIIDDIINVDFPSIEKKKCIFCGKKILVESKICRYCHKWLDEIKRAVEDIDPDDLV